MSPEWWRVPTRGWLGEKSRAFWCGSWKSTDSARVRESGGVIDAREARDIKGGKGCVDCCGRFFVALAVDVRSSVASGLDRQEAFGPASCDARS